MGQRQLFGPCKWWGNNIGKNEYDPGTNNVGLIWDPLGWPWSTHIGRPSIV